MSTKYKNFEEVPTEILSSRLIVLSDIVSTQRIKMPSEFVMHIPGEMDRDPDLVLANAAVRLTELQAEVDKLREKCSVTMGVGSGTGNLFVHGDYDSIKAAQNTALECERLSAQSNRLLRHLEVMCAEYRHDNGPDCYGDTCLSSQSKPSGTRQLGV